MARKMTEVVEIIGDITYTFFKVYLSFHLYLALEFIHVLYTVPQFVHVYKKLW